MLAFATSEIEIHRGIPEHVGGIGAVVDVRRVRRGGALFDAGEGEVGLSATSGWLW
jgi:hypothetical protein